VISSSITISGERVVDHTVASQALVGFGSLRAVAGSGPVLGAGLPVVLPGTVRPGVLGVRVHGLGVQGLAVHVVVIDMLLGLGVQGLEFVVMLDVPTAHRPRHAMLTGVAYSYALESAVETALASDQWSLWYAFQHRDFGSTESTSFSRRTCIWDRVSWETNMT
jgi:hypothetical protein